MTSADQPAPTAASDAALRRAIAVVIVVTSVWNLVTNLVLDDPWYVPANLAMAALLVVIARRAGLESSELGFGRAHLRRGLLLGTLSVVVIAAVLAVALLVPATESALEDDRVAADSTLARWLVPLVRIPLGTVVFEEILFRGVAFALVTRLAGTRVAVAATAVWFGLWHVVPAWETADGSGWTVAAAVAGTVLFTGVTGIVLALLRERSGSLAAPVIAHASANSLTYLAALVALESIT